MYVAVTTSLPAGKLVEVTVATPFVTVPVPRVTPPLVNVTVPVTVEGKVSVKVTELPETDGFNEDVSVEVTVALLTTWLPVPVAAV